MEAEGQRNPGDAVPSSDTAAAAVPGGVAEEAASSKSPLAKLAGDRYLLAAIALVIISITYWTFYAINAYNSFIYTSDLGFYLYDMYYDIHFPNIMGGLQLMVFGQHIAPDQFVVLMIYAVFQSPLTLPIVQLVVLSLTGLLVFWIARDLLKSEKLALAMCLAYLLNPGMHGMLIFDYHPEYPIVPFYMAAFYFYMKADRRMMLISLALLLCATETAAIVTVFLGLGLVAYQRLRNSGSTAMSVMLGNAYTIICAGVVALLLYNLVYYLLPSPSASIASGVFPIFRVAPYPLVPLISNSSQVLQGTAVDRGGISISTMPYVAFALVVVFLAFGIAVLLEPIPALIFAAPWLGMIFVFKNIGFVSISQQYFCFVVGAAFVAAVLGIMNLERGASWLGGRVSALLKSYSMTSEKFTVYSVCVMSVAIFAASFFFLGLPNVQNQMFFQANSTLRTDFSQLNYVLSRIPSNGNLSVEPFMMPHVSNRQYMEELQDLYLVPDYVVVDFNDNITTSNMTDKMNGILYNLSKIASYNLVLSNGTAVVGERNFSRPVNLPTGVR